MTDVFLMEGELEGREERKSVSGKQGAPGSREEGAERDS